MRTETERTYFSIKSNQSPVSNGGVYICLTAKELKRELPVDVEVNVKEILARYAKNAPFKYISNLDYDD